MGEAPIAERWRATRPPVAGVHVDSAACSRQSFAVIEAAAQHARHEAEVGGYVAAEAAAPVLDSPDFYADCRALLSDTGCMTVNLFGRASSFDRSLQSMAQAFGNDALWAFKPTREGNTVVLAQRTPSRPKRAELAEQAEAIQARWDMPTTKWLRAFKPVAP